MQERVNKSKEGGKKISFFIRFFTKYSITDLKVSKGHDVAERLEKETRSWPTTTNSKDPKVNQNLLSVRNCIIRFQFTLVVLFSCF